MNVPGLEEAFTGQGFRRVIQAVRELAMGGTNALSGFMLEAGQPRTTVIDRACKEDSLPAPVPCDAAAAASGWFVESVGRGQFTIGHFDTAGGATFRYELRQP